MASLLPGITRARKKLSYAYVTAEAVMQFRHIKLRHTANLLLAAIADSPAAVTVSETITADGLVFDPPLGPRRHDPEDLADLQERGLIHLRRENDGWRVTVTPRGRDYLGDTIF